MFRFINKVTIKFSAHDFDDVSFQANEKPHFKFTAKLEEGI